MDKRGLIGVIVIVGVLLVVGFFWFVGEWNSEEVEEEIKCVSNEECVPEPGCHPTECVLDEGLFEDSNITFCTAVCSGPLDCGAGSCGCVNNKCKVIPADNE